jgi:hypothetical protein
MLMGGKDDAVIPKGKFEWNLNTLVLIGGIVVGLASTAFTWGTFANRLENADAKTSDWITRHENLHRERQAAALSSDARMDEKLSRLDQEVRKIENLSYRVTVAEQSNLNTSKSIERLTETVNQQSTDIRVMREIIEQRFGSKKRM